MLRIRHSRRPRRRRSDAGQSVVEFSLVLPILVILMLAIVDLARIYTTMVSVESAAREAADYGSFGSSKWNVATYATVPDGAVAKMQKRACVAASDLPDYVGPDTACTNPGFTYALSTDRGATWVPYDASLGCDNPSREPPCWLKVTLTYDFKLLVPLNISLFGNTYGVPSDITFQRESVFPMTDLGEP